MNPITGLSLARIALGSVSLAAPDLASKLFGLDGAANRQLPYMTRMFASREIALGAITLLAPTGARKRLVTVGMAVDSADAYAGYAAWQSGSTDKKTALLLSAPAVGAVLAGTLGLLEKKSGRGEKKPASSTAVT